RSRLKADMPRGSTPFRISGRFVTARSVEPADSLRDGIIPSAQLSLPTSLLEKERMSWPAPPGPRGRGPRSFRFRRGWIALGVLIALLFTGGGAYLAYLNTLPTTVALNISHRQREAPSDPPIAISFTRGVTLQSLEPHFAIAPATQGSLISLSGQTKYEWIPAKPLADL